MSEMGKHIVLCCLHAAFHYSRCSRKGPVYVLTPTTFFAQQDIPAGSVLVRVPLRLAITDVMALEEQQRVVGQVCQLWTVLQLSQLGQLRRGQRHRLFCSCYGFSNAWRLWLGGTIDAACLPYHTSWHLVVSLVFKHVMVAVLFAGRHVAGQAGSKAAAGATEGQCVTMVPLLAGAQQHQQCWAGTHC